MFPLSEYFIATGNVANSIIKSIYIYIYIYSYNENELTLLPHFLINSIGLQICTVFPIQVSPAKHYHLR